MQPKDLCNKVSVCFAVLGLVAPRNKEIKRNHNRYVRLESRSGDVGISVDKGRCNVG